MSTGPWDWARLKPCGTYAAYRRHLRRGERPCQACLAADRRAFQDRAAAINERRAQRYAAARAAGMTVAEAKAARGLRRAS